MHLLVHRQEYVLRVVVFQIMANYNLYYLSGFAISGIGSSVRVGQRRRDERDHGGHAGGGRLQEAHVVRPAID